MAGYIDQNQIISSIQEYGKQLDVNMFIPSVEGIIASLADGIVFFSHNGGMYKVLYKEGSDVYRSDDGETYYNTDVLKMEHAIKMAVISEGNNVKIGNGAISKLTKRMEDAKWQIFWKNME